MNKKIFLGIIAAIIIIAAGYLAISRRGNEVSAPQTRLADDSAMANNESLRDLISKEKPLQCRVVVDGATNKFYLADKKMRSDFSTVVNGKVSEGHMIINDEASYTWMEGEKTGFKVPITDEDKAVDTSNTEVNKSVDLDSKIKYDCEPWSKDNSYFEVPTGVEFTDFGAMMPKTESPETPVTNQDNLKAMQCAACNNAPAESREQCKASLGCN